MLVDNVIDFCNPKRSLERHHLSVTGVTRQMRNQPVSSVPRLWYKSGMARVRISTTVDEQLLAAARHSHSGVNDSALIDEALGALLARNRAVEIDAAYAAYERLPLDARDEWGDLASFRAAAGSS